MFYSRETMMMALDRNKMTQIESLYSLSDKP